MAEAQTEVTERIARRYFEAWTSRDSDTVASVLDPAFRFTGGGMVVEGREAFLEAGAFPNDATTSLVAEAYQGEIGFQLYESTRRDRFVLIAEKLTVRDGRIVDSTFVTDMTAFGAFMGAP